MLVSLPNPYTEILTPNGMVSGGGLGREDEPSVSGFVSQPPGEGERAEAAAPGTQPTSLCPGAPRARGRMAH